MIGWKGEMHLLPENYYFLFFDLKTLLIWLNRTQIKGTRYSLQVAWVRCKTNVNENRAKRLAVSSKSHTRKKKCDISIDWDSGEIRTQHCWNISKRHAIYVFVMLSMYVVNEPTMAVPYVLLLMFCCVLCFSITFVVLHWVTTHALAEVAFFFSLTFAFASA